MTYPETMKYRLICLDCNVHSESMEFIINTIHKWLLLRSYGDYPNPELCNLLDFLCEHSGHRIEFKDEKGKVSKPHELKAHSR